MKVVTFVLACLLWAFDAQAQVVIAHQPDPVAWYGEASGLLKTKGIAAADLPKIAAGPVAPTLADDLKAFDWMEAGIYNYKDGVIPDANAGPPCQINVRRYQADGSELTFAYSAPCAEVTTGKISHYNFENPPVKTLAVVTNKAGTWLKSTFYAETALNRVVSYADGVLVVDVSRDGKMGSKPGIRTAYIALPKRFEWKFGE